MLRALLLALLLAIVAPVASAQTTACPTNALTGGAISAGTRVKILAVSSDDAYYSSRGSIIGKLGRVDGLDSTGSCWYGGQFYGDDGSSYYFYQVAVQREGTGGGGCPAGASTGSSLSSGTRVRVLTVSPSDAYYSTRGSLEGKVGRVDGTWGKTGEPCWYAGQFYGDDGSSNYFYQAAVEVLGTGGMSCPSSAFTGASVTDGARVRILTVSSNDAYYSTRGTLEGKVGRVSGTWSKMAESCWFAGQFYGDDGTSAYFYQAAVELLAPAAEAPIAASNRCPPGASTRASIPGGSRVKILALHSDDAYHPNAATYIGVSGRVEGDLHSNDGCWMGGGFTADDGTYLYFYKVAVKEEALAVERTGGACPAGASTAASIPGGSRVKILGIHPEDAYYGNAADHIGVSGTVDGDLHSNDGCWMGGGMTADDGTGYYFYKAAFQLVSGGPGGRYMGSTIGAGQTFRIVAIEAEDAYYPTRADVIGKTCTPTETMQSQGPGWYSGPVTCTDRSEYYFFRVGVVLE